MIVINFGMVFVVIGEWVLVIDFDLQGNVFIGFGIEYCDCGLLIYEILSGDCIFDEVIWEIVVQWLWVVLLIMDFLGLELEIVLISDWVFCLCNVIEMLIRFWFYWEFGFIYILVDCLLLLNFLMINVLLVFYFIFVLL